MNINKKLSFKCRFCKSNYYFIFHYNNLYFPGKDKSKWENIYCQSCGNISHFNISNYKITYDDGAYRDRNIKNEILDNKTIKILPPVDPWSIQSYKRWKNIYKNLNKYSTIFHGKHKLKHLDFGGYNGFLSHALNQLINIESTVADLDKRGLNIAASLGFKTINLSDTKISNTEKYNFITLIHVLEHFEDPKKTLLEIKENLIIDGLLYIEVPNLYGIPMYGDTHLSSFDLKSLEFNLLNLGFDIIKSGYSASEKETFNYGNHYISKQENLFIICKKKNKNFQNTNIDKNILFKNKKELFNKLNYEYSKISIKSISIEHLKKIILHSYFLLIFFISPLIDFIFAKFVTSSPSYALFKPLKSLKQRLISYIKK